MKKIQPYKLYLIMEFTAQVMFSLIFTVNLLYHINTAKLNPLQLILVGTVLELSVFLFEIPTGIVADTKSRKLSIIIGYTLMGIGFIIEGLIPIFYVIVLSQLFFGIGYTFISGATQAWIIDEIGEEKAGNVFVKGSQLGQIGEFVSIPLSIVIGLVYLNLPIVIGGVGMVLLAIFLIIVMPENGFKPVPRQSNSPLSGMLTTIKSTRKFIKINHIFTFIISIGLIYGLYSEGFDRLWLAHLIKDFDLTFLKGSNSVIWVGIIRGISIFLSIIGLELLNSKIDFKNAKLVIKILSLSSFIIVISLVGFSMISNVYIALVLFWLIGIMRCITGPLLDTMLNDIVTDSSIRATIFSIRGQVDSIGQIAGGPIVGFFGVQFGIKVALLTSALLLSPVIIIYKVVLKNLTRISLTRSAK